ncbi:MAG: Gfo/Idh/MocA family oxidoreductase [Planctomycetota bacterium]
MAESQTRRQFLKTSGAAVGGAVAISSFSTSSAYAQGSDTIRVALVGCGGRGTGAVSQIFRTQGNTQLVAVADALENKANGAVNTLRNAAANKVAVTPETTFVGMDAYKKAIDTDCDLVVIATPPGFKPPQFEYAVEKGKHIFMEKPVASDAPGVRRCLAAVVESKKKNLFVAIGLQRRHEEMYIKTVDMLQNGAIGDIDVLRVYWNGGGIWYRKRQPWMTDMQDQCNNWFHTIWTCGDQICEQHIHNIDVGCWVKGDYPIEANGMGGWGRRLNGDGKESQIYDHTFVEYTFADGSKMYSQGRHLQNSFRHVGEYAHGSKGQASISGGVILDRSGNRTRVEGKRGGHLQEQHDLIEAMMRGEVYNEGEYGCKSTFAAILGREACYSGNVIKWNDLLERGKDYCPGIDDYTINSLPPARRDENGAFDIPKPGIYDPFAPLQLD